MWIFPWAQTRGKRQTQYKCRNVFVNAASNTYRCARTSPYTLFQWSGIRIHSLGNPWVLCVYLLDFWLNVMHEDFEHLPCHCYDLFIHRRCFVSHTHFITYFGTHIAPPTHTHTHASSSYISNGRMMIKIGEMVLYCIMAVSCGGKWTATTGYRHNRSGEMRQVNDIMAHSGAIVEHWPHITWNILWQYISENRLDENYENEH